jgi:hypothetical protein
MFDLEKLQAVEVDARKKMESAKKVWERANSQIHKAIKALELAKIEYSFSDMLEVYLTVGNSTTENERGYNALKAMADDELKHEDGLIFCGGYNPKTNQRALTIIIDHDWDAKKMDVLSKKIEKWLPYIRSGALGNYDYGKKVRTTERDNWKAFSIMEHGLSEYGVHYLVQKEDATWAVAIMRWGRWEYSNNHQTSLIGVLGIIRQRHWYSNGEREEENEYED